MRTPQLTAMLVLLVGTACWTDLRWRRIPNALVLIGLGSALILQASAGAQALSASLLGAGAALLLGFALFASGGLGGGDAKLLAAVGAFFGLTGLPLALALIALAGGVLALGQAAREGELVALVRRVAALALFLASMGRYGSRRTLDDPGAPAVPYGVAIAAGSLCAWLL